MWVRPEGGGGELWEVNHSLFFQDSVYQQLWPFGIDAKCIFQHPTDNQAVLGNTGKSAIVGAL